MTSRVVLASLIIVSLLVLFMVTFSVEPLKLNQDCTVSHGRFTLHVEQDVRTGLTVHYNYEAICDQFRPLPAGP